MVNKGLAVGGLLAALSVTAVGTAGGSAQDAGAHLPQTRATTLDGKDLTLPQDLSDSATVLILGFGRHSQDATTAWERPVRQQLAQPGAVGFYDMAMLAEVPGFVRPLVLRSIRKAVPDVLKPHFLPLTDSEDAWKRVAGYDPSQPDAAYVLLVDHNGTVHWATHEAFSAGGFDTLRRQSHELATSGGHGTSGR